MYLCTMIVVTERPEDVREGNQVKVLNCSCSCKPHCKYRHESTDQRVGKEAMLVGKVRRPAIYHFFSPDAQEKGPA